MTVPESPYFLHQMEADVHELCQPLTALQFRLEFSKATGGQEALQEALDASLQDTQRMIGIVHRMQSHLAGEQATHPSGKRIGGPAPDAGRAGSR
jgi:signal transduction histidine kinase